MKTKDQLGGLYAASSAAVRPVSLPVSLYAATQDGVYKKPLSWLSTSILRRMRSRKLSTWRSAA